jgi:GAF domain-containing protein
MATLPENRSVAIDELESAIIEMESRLESHRAERDEAKARQVELEIENANLRRELNLAREQQKASAGILSVISSSVADTKPVFESILSSIKHLFDGEESLIFLTSEEGLLQIAAARGANAEAARERFPIPIEGTASELSIRERRLVRSADVQNDPDVPIDLRETARRIGQNYSMAIAPMLWEDKAIGTIFVGRTSMVPFTDRECELLNSFADQAVIAIQNARLVNDTREALERQTATADILKVIASSPSDVQPVFEAIAESAKQLLGGFSATVLHFIGDELHLVAFTPTNPAADEGLQASFPRRVTELPIFELVRDGATIQFPDTEADGVPATNRDLGRLRGFRSVLFVPLMNQGKAVGILSVTRTKPGAFAKHHVQLLQTFADQAVIAIENARLFNETREALERQTATAEILKVIASSPSDVQPVFDAIAHSANRLIGGFSAAVFRYVDRKIHLAAFTPTDTEGDSVLQSSFPVPLAKFPPYHLTREGTPAELPDTELEPAARDIARARGYRSMLFAPLMNEGEAVGIITVTRVAPGAFGEQHTRLLQMFADQAVIAIKNVRLFNEVQQRTEDLSEALQQQTATADVLKVISRSAFDLETVLNTLTESAARLCDADMAAITRQHADGGYYHATRYNFSPEWSRVSDTLRLYPGRGSVIGRVLLVGKAVQIPDVLADPEYGYAEQQRAAGYRTLLGVPLLREGQPIGVLFLGRTAVEPFTDRQIELVQTFADQAVIAIENVRLFDEVQAKTRDLTESLQQQTATADVLRVISASPGELAPVFQAMLENAVRLCEAKFAMLFLLEEGQFRAVRMWNIPPAFSEFLAIHPIRIDPKVPLGRVVATKQPVQVPDVLEDQSFVEGYPGMVNVAELGGARTLLQVPMLKDDELVGSIGIYRQEVRLFTDKQVALVQNFAAQAVIAMENARLLNELRQRTNDLSQSLDDLRTAQDRLIQTEKLASLGQLTAGIAHEIKNPLNFVNNFAALSAELTEELNDVLKPTGLADKIRAEVEELTGLLKGNLEKVVQHGKRADSIVKNMLLHSREGGGEHRLSDINALVDESLNLAYHGARAEKPGFNVTLERNFDPAAGQLDLFPQEITRVFLNLVSNGFYAVTKRRKEFGEPDFEPTLRASTKDLGDAVEIRIRDNGTGIPPEVKEKMFNPFFTTKPAGEGTGLGLSMSHDIIVKQHGGTIDVDTERGHFTEFRIVLPRTSNFAETSEG